MANANAPLGAVPYGHLAGGVIRASSGYTIASAYATSIYQGDWVKLAADGTIQRAAAGDTVLGVFEGCNYQDATGKNFFRKYWPASTAVLAGTVITANVYDDPFILWEMQHNGTPAGTADVGLLYDIAATAGTALEGDSAEVINTSTGATSGHVFQQIGFSRKPDNDPTLQYARGVFRVVLHQMTSSAGV